MTTLKVKDGVIFFTLFFVLVLIDQASKFAAYHGNFASFLNSLSPLFAKVLFKNYNFAFSLKVPVLIAYLVYFFLLFSLSYWMIKGEPKEKILWFAFFLILSGAFSNIIDRLWMGYVRDFIYVFWGNIFNVADIFILAGIILYIKRLR